MRCALALLAALCPAGPALAQGQGLGTFCNGRLAVDSARSEPLADGSAVQHVLQLRNLLPFPLRYQLPESPTMAASIPDLTPPPSPAPPSAGGPALPGLGGGGAAVTGPGGGGDAARAALEALLGRAGGAQGGSAPGTLPGLPPASAPGSGALAPAPPRGAPGAPYRGTGEAPAQTWLLAFESVTVRVLAEAPPQDGAPRSSNWRGLRISCPG